jgi:aminoglycoside 2'-N-acetyltransferase I
MLYQVHSYPDQDLPTHFRWQILSFMRTYWPDGFQGRNELRDWITSPELHPFHFVLSADALVISYAGVVWAVLNHAGEEYKVYGLSGVFTFPAHQGKGFGKQIVTAATNYIKSVGDADAGLLWCEPKNLAFYAKRGWIHLENARTVSTVTGQPFPENELVMMMFLSEKGQQNREAFSREPIAIWESAW